MAIGKHQILRLGEEGNCAQERGRKQPHQFLLPSFPIVDGHYNKREKAED